jgi:hypothetical protein
MEREGEGGRGREKGREKGREGGDGGREGATLIPHFKRASARAQVLDRFVTQQTVTEHTKGMTRRYLMKCLKDETWFLSFPTRMQRPISNCHQQQEGAGQMLSQQHHVKSNHALFVPLHYNKR